MQCWSTGEVAVMFGVAQHKISYAVEAGRVGPVAFSGGRRVFTPANIRALARHFGKPIPREALADLDPAELEQEGPEQGGLR